MTAPRGVGVYAREPHSVDEMARFDFVALSVEYRNHLEEARALRARGVKVFFFAGPDAWRPATWPDGLARCLAACRAVGGQGIIADPEMGWADLSNPERDQLAEALGRSLADVARTGLSVGLTSYPTHICRHAWARGCDGLVWGSPQIYARTTYANARARNEGAQLLAQWVDDWRRLFPQVIPSVLATAGAGAADVIDTPEEYARYLSEIPRSAAVIGWAGTAGDSWRLRMLRQYEPGGSAIGTVVEHAIEQLANPGELMRDIGRALGGDEGSASTLSILAATIAATVVVLIVGALIWLTR